MLVEIGQINDNLQGFVRIDEVFHFVGRAAFRLNPVFQKVLDVCDLEYDFVKAAANLVAPMSAITLK